MSGVRAHIAAIDRALDALGSAPSAERERTSHVMHELLEAHRAGLARLLDQLEPQAVQRLCADEEISAMLMLHGLHRTDLRTRVEQAVSKLAPRLAAQRASVELIDVRDDRVRVRIEHPGKRGAVHGQIEEALSAAAADAAELQIDEVIAVPVKLDRLRAPQERCDFCNEPVAASHVHVMGPDGKPRCACQACAMLFPQQRVDSRAEKLPADACSSADWTALGIPVGLAWLFRDAKDQRIRAQYPGAAGAVEAALSDARPAIVEQLEPGTQALLVRRRAGNTECWRVSMDHCWRLAGLLRRHWRGFDGGAEVPAQVDAFFAELAHG